MNQIKNFYKEAIYNNKKGEIQAFIHKGRNNSREITIIYISYQYLLRLKF